MVVHQKNIGEVFYIDSLWLKEVEVQYLNRNIDFVRLSNGLLKNIECSCANSCISPNTWKPVKFAEVLRQEARGSYRSIRQSYQKKYLNYVQFLADDSTIENLTV